jgi:hypothetical protein
MIRAWRITGILIVVAVAAGIASLVLPGWRPAIVPSAALLLLGVLLREVVVAISGFTGTEETAFDREPAASRPGPERPQDLTRLERLFDWKNYSPAEFDYRIRPVLERLIRHRLGTSRADEVTESLEKRRSQIPPELAFMASSKSAEEAGETCFDTAYLSRLVDKIESL